MHYSVEGIAASEAQGAQPLERSGATQAATRTAASQSAIHTWSQTMYRSAPFFAGALNGSRCWYHSPPSKGHTRLSWPFVCSRPGSSEPSSQIMPFPYTGATITRIKGTQPGHEYPGWIAYIFFVLNVTPHFLATLVMPIFAGQIDGKRTKTNRSTRCKSRVFRFVLIMP